MYIEVTAETSAIINLLISCTLNLTFYQSIK